MRMMPALIGIAALPWVCLAGETVAGDSSAAGGPERLALGVRQAWCCLDEKRASGRGASGVVRPAVVAIDMSPVAELAGSDVLLRGARFHFGVLDYEPFAMSGGMGFAGVGNGVRIGGGGMHGSRRFTSEPFGADSAVSLKVSVGYGGFMAEKGWVRGRWNFQAGGMVGGGRIEVEATRSRSQSYFDGGIGTRIGSAAAPLVFVQTHGGATYSVFRLLHLGAGLTTPVFISPSGFESRTGDFATVNPGVEMRVVIGTLG